MTSNERAEDESRDTQTRIALLVEVPEGHPFTNDRTSIEALLTASGLVVMEDSLKYDGALFGFSADQGRSEEGIRWFQIEIDAAEDPPGSGAKCSYLEQLKQRLHKILVKFLGTHPITVRNDLAMIYGQECYPLINEAENLMRELITIFVGRTFGIGGFSSLTPNSISSNRKGEYESPVFDWDFIDLGHFLFKPYHVDNSATHEKIFTAHDITDFTINELKELVPRSNWDRFFSQFFESEVRSADIWKEWEELYKLRCEVAHNRLSTSAKVQRVAGLSKSFRMTLTTAIDNAGKVTELPADVREAISQLFAEADQHQASTVRLLAEQLRTVHRFRRHPRLHIETRKTDELINGLISAGLNLPDKLQMQLMDLEMDADEALSHITYL